MFEAAARLGSFSGAASELGMTQPAVTRQIRALERSLGTDLFVRTSNRSTLTELGQRLRDHVTSGFDVIEVWVEDAFLLQVLTPAMTEKYLSVIRTPQAS